jgi:hypothetical protein
MIVPESQPKRLAMPTTFLSKISKMNAVALL